MKLEQLTYFLEAAKHEHMGKAAKSLSISASAISHSIAALEEELGRELFSKKGKSIQLTEHGRLLAERAQVLLRDAKAIQDEISSDKLELRGHYRLAATHVLSSNFLAPAWAKIQEGNAKLSAELFTFRSSQVVNGIAKGEQDFGLCFNPQSHIELSTRSLHKGKLLVAVRKGHPVLKAEGKKRFTELSAFPATLPKAFSGIDVCERHPMFEKFGIQVKPDCLIDSYAVAIEKTACSLAWSFLPDWLIESDKRLECLPAPTGWDAPYEIAAVWGAARSLPPALVRLLEELETLLRQRLKVRG